MASAATRRAQAICMAMWLLMLTTNGAVLGRDSAISKENGGDYAYRYLVDDWKDSGVVTDRWEEKRGGVVRGAYSLMQPDGMVRSVDYEVADPKDPRDPKDKGSGFKAVVRYWPGPQRLLSAMSLHEALAEHPHPSVNTIALQGKDYDAEQPKRKQLFKEMFAPLRAELGLDSPRPSRSPTPSRQAATPRMPARYAARH